MNIGRILRITNFYFLLTGYQARWFDCESLRYKLTIWNFIYVVLLCVIYLICFSHHFENSVMLKSLFDISVFLRNLVRLQVLLSVNVFLFCAIEWRNVNKICNGLISVYAEAIKRQDAFDKEESLCYIMFFSTFVVASGIGLYIAIELNFELPTLDHIMISMALFMPNLTLAGCLRLYTLGLWLMKSKFVSINEQIECMTDVSNVTVIEIVNPVLSTTTNNNRLHVFYAQLTERIDLMAQFLKSFDFILQRQLTMLMGLNFNCLLAGSYALVYFETSWKVLLTNRNRRVFYAATSIVFICIFVDYGVLILTRWRFSKAKENLLNIVVKQLYGEKVVASELIKILKPLKRTLKQDFHLKMLRLVEFNTWNFLLLHVWMVSLIAMIVDYQYFNDQIVALNERLDFNETD